VSGRLAEIEAAQALVRATLAKLDVPSDPLPGCLDEGMGEPPCRLDPSTGEPFHRRAWCEACRSAGRPL
jgi:hypothetical protein